MSHVKLHLFAIGITAVIATSGSRAAAQTQPANPIPQQPPTEAAKPAQAQAADKPRQNRLAKETSPYLLLHAHNPVDWYPWGPEALAKAKAENKLIFLSVGYSSCYWCHVMERESFMDAEIAAFLNKHFVCIKVDREERPDIDEIYMTALRIYNQVVGAPGGGGWPLSMFLTPQTRPLAGGTYFPPRDKDGRDGFLSIIGRIQEVWSKDAEAAKRSGEQLADFVRQTLRRRGGLAAEMPGQAALAAVQEALAEEYDALHGGFGYSEELSQRPKFPEPSNLLFLIDRVQRHQDEPARKMLVATLEKMAAGGIRDHLGGGFHRYSTDRFWRIPHFEKMLYDNGQLATVYAEAYALSNNPQFQRITREILDFVLRELTDPTGGFYSALDAETNAKEGEYYVWEKQTIESALTADEFRRFAEVYGVHAEPNFTAEHGGKPTHYTLLIAASPEQVAARNKLPPEQLETLLASSRQKLLKLRSERPRPLTDTKILTSWNGLMIRGFADAGRILKEDRYLRAAQRAAEFVLANLRTQDGRLLRTFGNGQAKLNAYLDDYAYLTEGLIALHKATGELRWLAAADELMQLQITWYADEQAGGFFFTSSDHEELIARSKDPVDSATPAGNSVAVGNLVYLAKHLNKPEYLSRAEQAVRDSASVLERAPSAMPRMAISLAALLAAKAMN